MNYTPSMNKFPIYSSIHPKKLSFLPFFTFQTSSYQLKNWVRDQCSLAWALNSDSPLLLLNLYYTWTFCCHWWRDGRYSMNFKCSIQEQALDSWEKFSAFRIKIRLEIQRLFINQCVGTEPAPRIHPALQMQTGLYGIQCGGLLIHLNPL